MLWQIASQCPGLSKCSLLLIVAQVACSGVCRFQVLHYCSSVPSFKFQETCSPGNFIEYLVTCDSPVVVFDG